jgi:type IV pilus assembly protein PilO
MSEESPGKESLIRRFQKKSAPFFEKVGSLSRFHRIVISLVTFGIIIGCYVYFIYLPFQEEKARLDKQCEDLNLTLTTYKTKAATLKKYEALMEEAQARFNLAMAQLPDTREIPSLLTGISRSGNDAGLEFLLFQPLPEEQQTYYAEIPVSIKVLGGYHQVAAFFDQVARLNRIVNIRDIAMSHSQAKDPSAPRIETTCSAVTYMFVEKKDEKKPEDNQGKKKK